MRAKLEYMLLLTVVTLICQWSMIDVSASQIEPVVLSSDVQISLGTIAGFVLFVITLTAGILKISLLIKQHREKRK